MTKRGFTLVEVMLFLAISGALLAIAIGGTQRSIAEKRYNDTVDNLASYLEGLYSSVSYVSHGGGGNSKQAVYGKLVDMHTINKETTFKTYTILGNAETSGVSTSTDTLSAILNLGPTITKEMKDGEGNLTGEKEFIQTEAYNPSWGGTIMVDPLGGDDASEDKNRILLLILRHPRTGMTSTYVYYYTSEQPISTATKITGDSSLAGTATNTTNGKFKKQDANFCVDSDDLWSAGNTRRLIRIHAGANNSSGVEVIANDKKDGFCNDL